VLYTCGMTATLKFTAYHHYQKPDVVSGASVEAILATVAEAQALVARFPKSAGLRATGCNTRDGVVGHVRLRVGLEPNGANGGINETGLRRLRTVLRAAEKLGVPVAYGPCYGNSYPTQADFEAAVALAEQRSREGKRSMGHA
jgi:hypothetical protein